MVYSEMQRVGIYLLVMLAVSLFIYISIRFIQSFSTERMEKGQRTKERFSSENGLRQSASIVS